MLDILAYFGVGVILGGIGLATVVVTYTFLDFTFGVDETAD